MTAFGVSPARALQVPAPVPPPAAPASIASPARPCATPAPAADSWSVGPQVVNDTLSNPQYMQIAVDPWTPCLMYRARTLQDLDRSSDGGVTWTPVLHDVAVNPAATASRTQGMFAMRQITIPAPGVVFLAEDGNGDGVVASRDAGTTWQLSDTGIAGQPISSLTFAPSDATIAYATTDMQSAAGAPVGLYLSRDGGGSWSPVTFPKWLVLDSQTAGSGLCTGGLVTCATFPKVQVDPLDAGHLYVLVAADTSAAHVEILESTDFGQTWQAPIVPPQAAGTNPAEVSQLLVTHSQRHGVRLYVTNYAKDPAAALAEVASGSGAGLTWAPLPFAPAAYGRLAADATNGDRMVYLAPRVLGGPSSGRVGVFGFSSADGFDTAAPTSLGVLSNTSSANSYIVYPARSVLAGGVTSDPDVVIQPDRDGGFTVASHVACTATSDTSACFTPGPLPTSSGQTFDFEGYVRYLAPNPPGAAAGSAGGPGAGGGGGSNSSGGPSGSPSTVPQALNTLRSCPIPVAQQPASSVASVGSVAFDGVDLLYTLPQDTGGMDLGVIHVMDPVTCRAGGVISVQFNQQDLRAAAAAMNDPGVATTPFIDTLTYDPNHDALWFSLAPTQGQLRDIVPIFIARVVSTSSPGALLATATLHEFAPHFLNSGQGEDLLAYDPGDDTLWRAVWRDGVPRDGSSATSGQPGHVTASGVALPSCVNSFPWATGMATWVVGAPGRLVVQDEDDMTLSEVDARTCQVLRVMQHPKFGEASKEDDQMACDSVTFRSALGRYSGAPTTALWLRDAATQTFVAFAMPDGACPLPTYTTYLSPHNLALGAMSRFCATVVTHNIEGYRSLPAGLPVTFSANSRQLGQAVTVGGPEVCTPLTAVPLPAGSFVVTATFGGTDAYLGSTGSGRLDVVGGWPTGVVPNVAYPLVPGVAVPGPPPPIGQPAPAGQFEGAGQAQAQIQAQAQAQAQAQGQSQSMAQLQPGMMVQPQRRMQTATQGQPASTQNVYQAAPLRRADRSLFVAASLVLALGFGILARRPRWAISRASTPPDPERD